MAGTTSTLTNITEYSAKFFGERKGCGLDFGGSLIKTVILQPKDDTTDTLLEASFNRNELDKAIALIKDRCGADVKGQVMYSTGVGCHQNKDKICSDLKISKLDNLFEMDCFVTAFTHLAKNRPIEEIVYPKSKVAEEYIAEVTKKTLETIRKMREQFGVKQDIEFGGKTDDPPPDVMRKDGPPPADTGKGVPPPGATAKAGEATEVDSENLFPCHLVTMGSGTMINQVEEDGSFQLQDGSSRGGRSFLSLCSLMTGINDYKELIALSKQGDNTGLDVAGKHLKTGDEGDIYSVLPDDLILYSYGHGNGKQLSDFKKEDICKAILNNLCSENVEMSHLVAALAGVKHVFFCGSFACETEMIRDEISKLMLKRIQSKPRYPMKFHFLKNGSFLGAIGAMIKGFQIEGAATSTNTKEKQQQTDTHL